MSRTRPTRERTGVAVYSAHRDTHFRFLRDVAIGDEIDVTRQRRQKFRYRANSTSVGAFRRLGIDPLSSGYELVLSTCWPVRALRRGRIASPAATLIGPVPELIRRHPAALAEFSACRDIGALREGRYRATLCCHPPQVSIKRMKTHG